MLLVIVIIIASAMAAMVLAYIAKYAIRDIKAVVYQNLLKEKRREEEIQQQHLIDISRFAANNKYKAQLTPGDKAFFSPDIPAIIKYIDQNYILTKRIKE